MRYFDYVIVGGGASGLMMAFKMANDSFFDKKSILIIDQEKKTKNDRTWCFWEKEQSVWNDILETSWNKIIFKSNSFTKVEHITPYTYKMIRSSKFYKKIWDVLDDRNNISFLKADVVNVSQEEEIGKVVTTDGEFFSKNIINSILFSDNYKTQQQYPLLQQHFVGCFIKTEEPFFDNTVATFMDFSVPQKGNTRFMYLLPYSKDEALFEYTLFSKDLLPYKQYINAIETYLQEKGIKNYEITDKEQGSIPMTSYEFWKKNSQNIIHIGTAGGWSKASTGFTFKNIDRKTSKLIYDLKENKSFKNFYKKNKYWWYDLVLLDILSKNNQLGDQIFTQLFRGNSTSEILKFLDEETSFLEEIRIFSKMPKRLFAKTLLKRVIG